MPFPLRIFDDLYETQTPVGMSLIDDISCSGEDFLYPALASVKDEITQELLKISRDVYGTGAGAGVGGVPGMPSSRGAGSGLVGLTE